MWLSTEILCDESTHSFLDACCRVTSSVPPPTQVPREREDHFIDGDEDDGAKRMLADLAELINCYNDLVAWMGGDRGKGRPRKVESVLGPKVIKTQIMG